MEGGEIKSQKQTLSFPVGDVYSRTGMDTEYAGDITEVPMPETSTHQSVTAVLNFCKQKILNPYLRLLSLIGLRPLSLHPLDTCTCLDILSHYYAIQVIAFVIAGYVIQYMACFRRDRGFCCKVVQKTPSDFAFSDERQEDPTLCEEICQASILFSFVIPSVLHLIAYLHAVAVFRSSDDDQLPSLMERVFIASTNLSDGLNSQKRLVRTLWIFVVCSGIWMLSSFVSVNVMMTQASISFKWVDSSYVKTIIGLKGVLTVCTLWHDVIQGTIVSNYCLQAQLLTSYAQFLKAKLIQQPVDPIQWMRDTEEFKKILKYFNEEISPSVCILTFVNMCCSISGILWLLNYDKLDKDFGQVLYISVVNVCLWIFIAVAPFVQAAKLTSACEDLGKVGHEVRIKPFFHQDTPGYELDSALLYASTLKINARLFAIPIYPKYLCLILLCSASVVLILGQIHFLNA